MRCKELRLNRRHAADFTAYLMWDGELIAAMVKNVSLEGLLLECHGVASPACTPVYICCIVSRRFYEIKGRIAHIHNSQIGICFNTPQLSFHQAVLLRAKMENSLMTTHRLPLPCSNSVRTSSGNLP